MSQRIKLTYLVGTMKVILYNMDMFDHMRSKAGGDQMAELKRLRDQAASRK